MAPKNFRADGAEALKRLRAGAGTGDDSKEGARHKEVWLAGEEFTGLGAAASMGILMKGGLMMIALYHIYHHVSHKRDRRSAKSRRKTGPVYSRKDFIYSPSTNPVDSNFSK